MAKWEIVYERGTQIERTEVEAASVYRPEDGNGIIYLVEEDDPVDPVSGISVMTDKIVFLIPVKRVISIHKLG